MEIRLDEIYIGERLREEYDLDPDKPSIEENGQLQAILVRRPDPTRPDEVASGQPWVLVDGGRRYFIFKDFYAAGKQIRGVTPGHILAITREQATELQALTWEFDANYRRKNFNWQETAKYVRQIHAMLLRQAPEYWTVELTAQYLKMGEVTVYKYLQLTQDPEIFNDPEVQSADSFNTAYKKTTIVKDKKKRIRNARQHEEALTKEANKVVVPGEGEQMIDLDLALHRIASTLAHHADLREWCLKQPPESADCIHWDPPYGNRGFAHSSHEYFQDDWAYASQLMRDGFVHAHRLLKDGHWFLVWHAPQKAEWVKRTLQGHKLGTWKGDSTHTPSCVHCGGLWEDLDDLIPCRGSDVGFWVNPLAYIWFKPDRQADGHEIKRFSLNQYEACFMAAKNVEAEPILIDSSRSNVLQYNTIPRAERRHPTHKPPSVLTDLLSRVTVPGELVMDLSFGSGSIFEAALRSKRRIVGCELDEGHWAGTIEVIKGLAKELGITTLRDLKTPLETANE
jgi:hypothetical protein